MSNCVHDNGEYCEVFSDKEVRQPCFETPLCEDYKGIVHCEDCKYWAEAGREYNPNTNSWSAVMVCDYDECPEGCGHTCWSTDAEDFCSRGEKKDE